MIFLTTPFNLKIRSYLYFPSHISLTLFSRDKWKDLLASVDGRDHKLYGAAEIHRFNRDVEDALSRIQEKYTSIPDDVGKDLKAVQGYTKKHEGFENELVALEAQVKIENFTLVFTFISILNLATGFSFRGPFKLPNRLDHLLSVQHKTRKYQMDLDYFG